MTHAHHIIVNLRIDAMPIMGSHSNALIFVLKMIVPVPAHVIIQLVIVMLTQKVYFVNSRRVINQNA